MMISNNRLFNLPASIIMDIYEMDSTYRDKIRDEIKNEIVNKSWTTFKNQFLSQSIFRNQYFVVRKIELLLEYLQNTWSSLELIPSSDIVISTNWKMMTYDNYMMDYNDDYDYDVDDDNEPLQFVIGIKSRRYTEISGIVYTNYQYKNYQMCNSGINDNDVEIDIYQNSEFKIVQCLNYN